MIEKLKLYALFIRLDRPIGIYLLLWPTLWALWIASNGAPSLLILFLFITGVTVMRSAGCAINDFADRDIDKHVARTQDRPLTSGKISTKEALGIFVILSLIAFLLVLQLNIQTIALSTIAILLAASYPFMKRYHSMPQVHLGAAFGWSVPMSYTAVTGELPPLAGWLLFAATLLWTIAYDTLYAITDRVDDLKIGVKSTAILFGKHDRLIIAILQLLTVATLFSVGWLTQLGWIYYTSLLIGSVFFVYQHWLIQKHGDKAGLRAFLNNNWFGFIVFLGIFMHFQFNTLTL
ncbi:MAG: 4-hydroxybenzoate polyprenyltransferase (EC [uncultured Thiotrichaceae bacterium]|uniref:4-hydroxybenzoate octaprenyltransferase n=1 Tax=uncultured Thiotrichaceae bacterium TaxID=298394 RepID=A0A6S6SU97_9GAMM|nr:MAG: 4-hydroxybenzoate polyprenyltransferase (EC [uncultured Thiotrichaceae bacterium]